MHDIYHALQEMNNQAKVNQHGTPYIYDMYNVRCFTANPLSELKNVATRLVNALIKALNDYEKLPRMIVIIPDLDILRFLRIDDRDNSLSSILQELIKWIITNMRRATEAKHDFLMTRKAGAVADNEPKIIWVKMINRFGSRYDPILMQKGRFNRILEDLLADEKSHYLMDVNVAVNDSSYFNDKNELNTDGRVKYWSELVEQIKLFDLRKLSLKPLKKDSTSVRMKMPTPPEKLTYHKAGSGSKYHYSNHNNSNSGRRYDNYYWSHNKYYK